MKRLSADGSLGFPHVRVGHCQALIRKPGLTPGLFFACEIVDAVGELADELIMGND